MKYIHIYFGISFNSLPTGKRTQRGTLNLNEEERVSFNSLPTGKRTQSYINNLDIVRSRGFQFPSNGKAYPKSYLVNTKQPHFEQRFNSLPTGKRTQSQRDKDWHQCDSD